MECYWHWSNRSVKQQGLPGQQEVWVWLADLDHIDEKQLQQWRSMLSEEERHQCQRLIREIHQRRNCAIHSIKRMILSRYFSCSPQDLQFVRGSHGKPYLAGYLNHGIQFNISHSSDKMVLAVTRGGEIGIDMEYLEPKIEGIDIAHRFFHQIDYEQLIKLPEQQRTTGFYLFWTLKESYIKAVGLGLSYPLNRFFMKIIDHDQIVLKDLGHSDAEKHWKMCTTMVENRYQISLTVNKEINTIIGLKWCPENNPCVDNIS